jgi:hypothetical protein
MNDLRILNSGLEITGDHLRYLWLHIVAEGNELYRCVALRELAYLPVETREDPDVLGKQWAAVRGLYNAGVDFVYTAAGIFTPERVGIAQFYGAAAEGATMETAADKALQCMAAVEAVIANYPQARLTDPALVRVEWILDFLVRRSGRNVLAVLGHPDPRMARRGLGRDGSLGEVDEDLASQQNEILFRGLAKLREDFIFLVTAAHMERRALAEGSACHCSPPSVGRMAGDTRREAPRLAALATGSAMVGGARTRKVRHIPRARANPIQ